MKRFTDQKGITLVALVITIIVLLILAGISLQLVLGENGILNRASSSSEMQKAATAREECEISVADKAAELIAKKYVNGTEAGSRTVGNYLKSLPAADTTLPSGASYAVTLKSGDETNAPADAKYTVTLTVPKANGNTTKTYTGTIDAQGKWDEPIDIKAGT